MYGDQLWAHWNNGRMIVVHEQNGRDRAEYGDGTLRRLSRRLTDRMRRGLSVSNLQYMRRFYLTRQKQQTASVKLSWSHYCELLDVSDDAKRSFYEYDNPPIGIILCTDKNNVRAQYALGGLSNAVFASTYTLRLLRARLHHGNAAGMGEVDHGGSFRLVEVSSVGRDDLTVPVEGVLIRRTAGSLNPTNRPRASVERTLGPHTNASLLPSETHCER